MIRKEMPLPSSCMEKNAVRFITLVFMQQRETKLAQEVCIGMEGLGFL